MRTLPHSVSDSLSDSLFKKSASSSSFAILFCPQNLDSTRREEEAEAEDSESELE